MRAHPRIYHAKRTNAKPPLPRLITRTRRLPFFFSAAPDPPPTAPPPPTSTGANTPNEAINKLRDTIETHEKRVEHLQRKIDSTIEEEKKYMAQGAKGKPRALQCMKRKQIYQNQMDQLNNMKMNLENQMYQMQSLNMNQEQIRAQQQANRAMQAQMQAMGGIDGIQEVQDNAQDLLQDVAEINDVMGASIDTPGLDMDEDDLLAELEGLEGDTLTQQMGSVDLAKEMPSAPVQFPDAGTKEVKMTAEEKELAELQASMGM